MIHCDHYKVEWHGNVKDITVCWGEAKHFYRCEWEGLTAKCDLHHRDHARLNTDSKMTAEEYVVAKIMES
jgi:hypothetical protein